MKIRILTYVLALIFLASGGAKLLSLSFEIDAFTRWGYPISFMYFTGMLEVVGGLGLLVTRFSALASLCLAVFMLGAIATHVIHNEWPMFIVASIIAIAALWRSWFGRTEIKGLLISFKS